MDTGIPVPSYKSHQERAVKWPVDFDRNGEIRKKRLPCGQPFIVHSHGLHWPLMYKKHYILSGYQSTQARIWLVDTPKKAKNLLSYGQVLATQQQIQAGPSCNAAAYILPTAPTSFMGGTGDCPPLPVVILLRDPTMSFWEAPGVSHKPGKIIMMDDNAVRPRFQTVS